jgi:transmembrane sensor
MKPSYLADLLKRYLQDDITEGETWTIDQWYEARDMPRPKALTPAEQAAAKARAWQRIQARTRPRPVVWQRPAVRWAAAAMLGAGLGLSWLNTAPQTGSGLAIPPTFVPAGQLTTTTEADGWRVSTNSTRRALPLALADGSTVTLRPGSRLRYPAQFAASRERVVELRGEAFFDVFHESKRHFRVLTPQLETTVLGTSFWVRAVPGQAEATVEVRSGAVSVQPRLASPASPKAVVVRPNQQVVYSLAKPALQPVLVAEPVLLRPQPLHFDERPVAEVLASLQAGYGVPIRYDGAALAGCTVSLSFGAEDLFGKLDLLCKTLGTSYERTNKAIIFRSLGCQSE